MHGESTSMMWPTLGSRTAKEQEQNRTVPDVLFQNMLSHHYFTQSSVRQHVSPGDSRRSAKTNSHRRQFHRSSCRSIWTLPGAVLSECHLTLYNTAVNKYGASRTVKVTMDTWSFSAVKHH